MKKMLFLVMMLLSVISVKLYSYTQDLVFENPPMDDRSVKPESKCEYKDGDSDCSEGSSNYCAAIWEDNKCNSDPPQQ